MMTPREQKVPVPKLVPLIDASSKNFLVILWPIILQPHTLTLKSQEKGMDNVVKYLKQISIHPNLVT